MPSAPPRTAAPSWRTAWDAALYGPEGFYRRQRPGAHFRTSVHESQLMAEALLQLARRHGLTAVTDIGAGSGELLRALHRLAPDLRLTAVEVSARPADLPWAIDWRPALPQRLDGLVVANEWLDNVPCHVVEVDPAGVVRLVHVDPSTGVESLGLALDAAGVPPSLGSWLDRWWPLTPGEPGTRAEVGSTRDRAWAEVLTRLDRGVAVAVDHGHRRPTRPAYGSLRSYRDGREVQVLPDGSRDLTACVAVDALAAVAPADVVVAQQSEVLARLGVTGARPLALGEDPAAYLAGLARATRAAHLVAPGGLGSFYWVICGVGGISAELP